ncbi:MAG: hypothetical protein M3347_11915 [Armatimonadota bacterium]|nr:hypothetical protein [Armatimonadota bacterium]
MTISHQFQNPTSYERPKERQSLLEELERQADSGEMNIDYLVKLYKQQYPGEAVWALIQDINRQALVWYNVVETLKRSPDQRENLKKDYEDRLKLLPVGSLSNPIWPFDVDRAFEKLKNYSKGLLKIARSYTIELLAELNVEAGITVTVQVELGLPPSLTIGMEKSLSAGVAFGVSAAKS